MVLKCCAGHGSKVLIGRIVQYHEGEGLAAALLLPFNTSLKFETKTYVLEVWENCTITSVTLNDSDASRMEERCLLQPDYTLKCEINTACTE